MTLPNFARNFWEEHFSFPDWYNRLEDDLKCYIFSVVHDDPELKAWRNQVYGLLGELLERNQVPLAKDGPDLDYARQTPDTIVLHHTEEDAAIPLAKLSAIGLLRQYGFQYLENDVLGRRVRGEPVWSGHFRQGQMVFFAYHWLVRPDGTCERLLEDRAIGWHAGNWDINTRSIGLALSGNYEHAIPPSEQLAGAAEIMRTHYPSISRSRILGHREIRADLTCPGEYFLQTWKAQLLQHLP